MKAKFDSAQLKSFLLNHVEKIVFAGFIFAFVMICVSAFKQKPYEKKPDELKSLADRISQEVEAKSPPDKFDDLPLVPDFSNLGAVGPALVNAQFFKVEPLSLPYELRQERRKEPKFFALEEPLAYPGYGGIAINEDGGVVRLAGANDAGMDTGAMPDMGMGNNSSGMNAMYNQQMQQQMDQMKQINTQSSAGMSGMQDMMGGMGMQPGRRGRGATRNRNRNAARQAKPDAKPTPPPKPQITEKIVISQTPPNSHLEGRYWICLLGVIPYWQQYNEYQNTFREARYYQPLSDYPRYFFPQIERAEVVAGQQGDWKEVNVEDAYEDLKKWGAEYPDTALEKRFIDPGLTWPLPPLVFANHDKERIIHPKTKIIEEKPRVTEAEDDKKKPRARSLEDLNRQQANRQGGMMAGGNAGGMPGYGGMGGDQYGYGAMGQGSMTGRQTGVGRPLAEHRLFRFFDFSVEPGKTYTYRIKLVLRNPNYGVPPRFLEKNEFREGDSREADWSKPSPAVSVIAGNRLLAGGVNVSPGNKGEPTGQVLAKMFDADKAAEVRRVFEVSRGAVLNKEADIGLPDPTLPGKKMAAKVNIETNAVVLDMFGGEKLANAKSSKIPGHILVLDNDGEMRALLQASDAGVFETEEAEAKNQAPPTEEELAQPGGAAAGAPAAGGAFNNFDSLPDTNRRKPRSGR